MTIKAITTADQTVHIDFTAHPAVSLQVFSAQIIRVCAPEALSLTSHAVIATPSQAPFTVDRDNAGGVGLQTSALHLHIDASGHVDVYDANDLALVLDYRGQRVPLNLDLPEDSHSVLEEEGHAGRDSAVNTVSSQVIKALSPDEHFYGLGDKTGFIDKRGYEYDNWNTDDASPHLEHYTKLYKSVPILYGLREGRPYGLFFDNAARSHLDLGKENPGYYYYSVAEGPLDYYVIGGPTLASVVQQYTQLTGPTPLPQRWTLGYQQSRFGWQDAAEVSEIAATMRRYHLPCDVLHLDIDYMAGGQEIRVEVPLDALPLFGRVGTMVPMGPKQEYLTDAPDQEMDFRCFGDHGTYRHYQDDGSSFAYRDGAYNLYQITVSAGVAAVTVTHAGDAVALYREIRVHVGHSQQKFVLDKQQYCALNKKEVIE